MAGSSAIEWTEQTWNPIVGCSIVSPGCTNCYAMKMAARIEAMGNQPRYAGTTRKVNGKAVWTGKVSKAPNSTWCAPIERKKPTVYFVNSMSDLFHEDVPDDWILDALTVMAIAHQHTFQVLTKRAARMREFMSRPDLLEQIYLNWYGWSGGAREVTAWPLPNVWLGVSTERQQEADERIPLLLKTPAAVRFISAEPLLGPIDLHLWMLTCPAIDWVIVGGESGPVCRPMHPGWARTLRDQCAAAGVPFFFKQWGTFHPRREDLSRSDIAEVCIAINGAISRGDVLKGGGVRPRWCAMERLGKKAAGRELDGSLHNEMPAHG